MISFYRESGIFDEDQLQLISYAMKSIINDISKLIILLFLALLTDMVVLFFMVMIPFVSVRTFVGGIHMKTYWGCFGVTAGFIFGSMFCAFYGEQYVDILLFWTVISNIVFIYIGPKISSNKRKMTDVRKKHFRILSTLLEAIYILLACCWIRNSMYQAGIYIALLISNIQVFILHIKEKKCVN